MHIIYKVKNVRHRIDELITLIHKNLDLICNNIKSY